MKHDEDYWLYSDQDLENMVYNLGDEYLKDGQWYVMTTYKEIDEVIRQGYPHRAGTPVEDE